MKINYKSRYLARHIVDCKMTNITLQDVLVFCALLSKAVQQEECQA